MSSIDPFASRQLRRCILPIPLLMEFLTRRFAEVNNTRLHHGAVDERRQLLFIYLETDPQDVTEAPLVDIPIDWQEIFGVIPCAQCGKPTPVERITVCEECNGVAVSPV